MFDQLKNIKGFAFDLDGTIVDSKLDFTRMRDDLNFPEDVGILEHLEQIECDNEKKFAWDVVNNHEMIGANNALLIDGVVDLIEHLKSKNIPMGILTRNSKEVAHISLNKFNLEFDIVLSRDDCMAKPSPEGLEIMANKWGLETSEIVFIGDHLFDVETAINAKSIPIMYDPHEIHPESDTYLKIKCYREFLKAV